jgi:phage shock protein PspC (stress-responsive transcriptional regulator)
MVYASVAADHRDMTQTPHDTAGPGGEGPRVPPAQMRDLNRLRRSTTDRRIAGVAGGIARHLDIDPTIVRVLLVVLVFFGGAGLLVYGAVWLLVPEDDSDHAPIRTSGETRTIALVVTLVVAALLLLGDGWWLGFGNGWPPPLLPLLVVGLVLWLVLRARGPRGEQKPPPGTTYAPPSAPPAAGALSYLPPEPPPATRAPRARGLFGITMAFVLLALGTVAVVEVAGTALPWAAYPATALGVIGLALLAGAFVGRSTGLVFSGLVAALVLAAAVWAPDPRFGDVRVHPARAELVHDSYSRTAGLIDLDLTDVRNPAALDGRVLDLDMRAGEVFVELPRGVDLDVTSHAQGGRLNILGRVVEGRDVVNNRSTPDTTAPDLRLDVDMGFGHVKVSTP